MQPGSEFQNPTTLQWLSGQYPNWSFFHTTLVNGMDYAFSKTLNEDTRSQERGSHKSAVDHSDKVRKLLEKDVCHGFSMVFDPAVITKIPHAMVQPLGVVE